jgi:hypothetical protein
MTWKYWLSYFKGIRINLLSNINDTSVYFYIRDILYNSQRCLILLEHRYCVCNYCMSKKHWKRSRHWTVQCRYSTFCFLMRNKSCHSMPLFFTEAHLPLFGEGEPSTTRISFCYPIGDGISYFCSTTNLQICGIFMIFWVVFTVLPPLSEMSKITYLLPLSWWRCIIRCRVMPDTSCQSCKSSGYTD